MSANTSTLTSDRIQDTLYAFTRSQILFTALDLDVFTHIDRGVNTLDDLVLHFQAEHASGDARSVRILLDGLVGIGFLEKKDDRVYQLPPDIRQFLSRESESYMGGMASHCKRLYENWGMLTDAVRSGLPVGGAQSLNQLETYFSELVKGLYVSNYPTARRLAAKLEMGSALSKLHVLDVAGGSAVWSLALLEKDPTSRATVLDFPTVIHVAEEYVAHHNLQDRYEYWAADLEEVDFPPDRFDLALLGNICHAIGPVSTQKLLKNMGKTLKPGGRVVIVDFVPDAHRSKPGWPLIFGVNMLISTPEGDVFTMTEYDKWLRQAGFSQVSSFEIETEVTAIVAIK